MLVITSGDPYSITVEALAPRLADLCARVAGPVVVVGSEWQWRDQMRRGGSTAFEGLPWKVVDRWPSAAGLYLFDIASDGVGRAPAETLASKVRGELSVRALNILKTLKVGTGPLAVVTAPIDKFAASEAGFAYPGQTEFFEALWQSPAVMILAGPRLRVGLATNHLALADVTRAIDGPLLARKLDLFIGALQTTFGIASPRVGVASLNPHVGDGGLFGNEDEVIVRPAVAAAQARHPGATVVGPLPADTAFHAGYSGRFDGVLAMYHDQGLGPLKTVHFDEAVNVSGGLPHLRVSPDHGPAKDLFLRQVGSATSFVASLDLALRHLKGREGGPHG